MFSFRRKIIVVFSILMSFSAFAEDQGKSTYILCKNGSVVRTIRVQLKGQSCKAIYTKEGTDQVVGKSGTPDVCFDIANKIKVNLEVGNWKCKDISQTRVSSSME